MVTKMVKLLKKTLSEKQIVVQNLLNLRYLKYMRLNQKRETCHLKQSEKKFC